MTIKLAQVGDDRAVAFAADELARYFKRMDPEAQIVRMRFDRYAPDLSALWIGQEKDLPVPMPEVKDANLDDAVYIDVRRGAGYIAGNNPRSALIAVYRFLRESGCYFPLPGEAGEIVPGRKIDSLEVYVREAADCRHRAVTIEGAVSGQNVLDMIDWIPKNGMNGYFIQFFKPYTFYERWYAHRENPYLPGEPISIREVMGITKKEIDEIGRRGLLYHAVGHGWTCEPFGVEGLGWDKKVTSDDPSVTQFLAEVSGKREIWEGIPLNTNLCYSNPEARGKVVQSVADYCAAHPEVHYLHLWLADGKNNHCECENCKGTLPSDYYVTLLNEIDGSLTAAGIDTKIVFLIYVDLLWAPERERIFNPERFTLMFAPITRTYQKAFIDGLSEQTPELAPYRRNQNAMPTSVEENLARLRDWQKQFGGDSFCFDYHLMWAHLFDPGYYMIAGVLWKDMKNLRSLGLNGMVSCQLQRAFFPNGLPMCVMAATLWSNDTDFDDFVGEFFERSLGEDGFLAQQYLKEISEGFDPPHLTEGPILDNVRADRLEKLLDTVDAFSFTIDKNLAAELPGGIRRGWELLEFHAEYMKRLLAFAVSRSRGEDFKKELDAFFDCIRRNELSVQPELDVFEVVQTYKRALRQE